MPALALAPAADRSLFRGYRFPPEVIAHAVWLYVRLHLSLRDVQDLLAERGLVVSHASIRQWCGRFGPAIERVLPPVLRMLRHALRLLTSAPTNGTARREIPGVRLWLA